MATITSAQSGSWTDGSTWIGGTVPDPESDAVVIDRNHTVTIGSGHYLSIQQSIQVRLNGVLRIEGGLESYGPVTVEGQLDMAGEYWFIMEGSGLSISSYGEASLGNTVVVLDASVAVDGSLTVLADAVVEISEASLTVSLIGSLTVQGELSLVSDQSNVIQGRGTIASGGRLSIHHAALQVRRIPGLNSGSLLVEGILQIQENSRVDLLGEMTVDSEGWLTVGSGSVVNVYQDLRMGGRMTGGGQIRMLRREGQILDGDGNSLVVFDRAYGYTPAYIG